MKQNPFFINKGPFSLDFILNECGLDSKSINKDIKINDIKNLADATDQDITFFHSIKYKEIAKYTKAIACITTNELKNYLPKNILKITTKDPLFISAKVTSFFYPNSIKDDANTKLELIGKIIDNTSILYGKNVLVGINVVIGNDTIIGHNSIIEDNVKIGRNCSIGSNVVLKNVIIKDNVKILDNCVIGKKGFGFIPFKGKNYNYPHIGHVVIYENCEIGAACTIDRGSLSNTVIGKNTFFDNQVHLAHNVKVGENCVIAGQVGIAGSSTIGDNVMIGGQAGISGHLKIGNNVKIGGGSGVIKNIPDNTKVMGYPAKSIRDFIKENRTT